MNRSQKASMKPFQEKTTKSERANRSNQPTNGEVKITDPMKGPGPNTASARNGNGFFPNQSNQPTYGPAGSNQPQYSVPAKIGNIETFAAPPVFIPGQTGVIKGGMAAGTKSK